MDSVSQLENGLNQLVAYCNQQKGILQSLQDIKAQKMEEQRQAQLAMENLELENQLLISVTGEAKKNAKETLEYMTSNALQFILNRDVSFKIALEDNGADFYVEADYGDVAGVVDTDPAEEEGGGIADICSSAIQMGMLNILERSNFAPLLLDEPSKYVSAGYSESFAKFLFEVSASTERQVIMVTHDQELAKMGDMAYHIRKEEGLSYATPL